jgi:hypothetical protein
MANGFELDEDQAYDRLAKATIVDDAAGSLTLYTVICWNDDVSSHGGFAVGSAQEAVEGAKELNEMAPEGHACRYIAVGIGVDEETYRKVFGTQ